MKHKIIKFPNYEIKTVKTDQFHMIHIQIKFMGNQKPLNGLYQNLLVNCMIEETEHYTTEELSKKVLELYGIDVNIKTKCYGKKEALIFDLFFADPKQLKVDYLEEVLDFFFEVVFHPAIKNGSFDEKIVNRMKEQERVHLSRLETEIQNYGTYKIEKLIGKNTTLAYYNYDHLDQLDKIDGKKLADFYYNIINNWKIGIYAVGNIDVKRIENYFKENLKRKKSEVFDNHYEEIIPVSKKDANYIQEVKNFHQSSVTFVYKIDNYTLDDAIVCSSINQILDSSATDLLMKELRERQGLVYHVESNFLKFYGVYFITAFIDRKNEKQTIDSIKKVIENLKLGVELENYLKKIKEANIQYLEYAKDNQTIVIDNLAGKDFAYASDDEEFIKKMEGITEKDVVLLLSRLKLDTIYFLEGDQIENETI